MISSIIIVNRSDHQFTSCLSPLLPVTVELPPGCLREHSCCHDRGPGRRHERGGGGRQRQQGQRRLPLERPHAPRPHRAEQKVTSGTGPWAYEMLASCYIVHAQPSFKWNQMVPMIKLYYLQSTQSSNIYLTTQFLTIFSALILGISVICTLSLAHCDG